MAKYESLPVFKLTENNTYSHPHERPELVYCDDPASEIMIDFEHVKPLITSPRSSIDEANVDLQSSRTHVMLVVDVDKVVGIVSSEDVLGEKPMQIIQERRVKRSEISVRAVMTPVEALIAINMEDLKHAKVGHILNTLAENKKHYALIVEINPESNEQIVHGLVYIYDVLKRLDKDLPSELREAKSLLELQHKLR